MVGVCLSVELSSAGVTTYVLFSQHGVRSGQRVGVVRIGGLGHMGRHTPGTSDISKTPPPQSSIICNDAKNATSQQSKVVQRLVGL
jgi:hypothetical protein